MLQMTSIYSSDRTVDLEYGLRYHASQELLPGVEEDAEPKWATLNCWLLPPPPKNLHQKFAVTFNFDKRKQFNFGK